MRQWSSTGATTNAGSDVVVDARFSHDRPENRAHCAVHPLLCRGVMDPTPDPTIPPPTRLVAGAGPGRRRDRLLRRRLRRQLGGGGPAAPRGRRRHQQPRRQRAARARVAPGPAAAPPPAPAPRRPPVTPPETEVRQDFEVPRGGARFVYVANRRRDSVAVIDSTGLGIRTVAVGDSPGYLTTVPGPGRRPGHQHRHPRRQHPAHRRQRAPAPCRACRWWAAPTASRWPATAATPSPGTTAPPAGTAIGPWAAASRRSACCR